MIHSIQKDELLLSQVEPIIYPCLFHSISIDGLDSIEEGLDCITMITYFGYKSRPISPNLWKIFPQLLYVCVGSDGDMEGGMGFEFVTPICNAL